MRHFLAALVLTWPLVAQGQPVTVGSDGVMRWAESDDEVALFGVNYSTPFAFAFRALERLGISHEAAIDADVAHMARLGLDAYRIHVWDREVSDSLGNLLQNEHLHLLDYLIARLKEHDIKILLTPIAWWGNGWPEPDTPTPGFSNKYSKSQLASDPEALKAQLNYFPQFLNHVNPETGLAYKNDPSIIAIELVNEPSHPEPPEKTTAYINSLVESVRSTGFDKPIFYNVSQNWSEEHAAAVAAADVQGVSFQWYPAGLVRRSALRANYLPHVDHYQIPSEGIEGFDRLAKMVYEFDAADIPGSYIYPAMARSFREAGMQWATQFAFDPMAIAYSNTEYGTHYVNLLYTPGKAISLMIAGEAFRKLPRGRSYGSYPQNTTFGPFRLSWENDLSEMVAPEKFYYSNTTSTIPPNPETLQHVAGVGNSPIVKYDGTGAYFLDKRDGGAWRLEVYPDAVWLHDPFGPVSLSHEISRLIWRRNPMEVHLSGLGPDFHVTPLNEGNEYQAVAASFRFAVEPGIYLLTATGQVDDLAPASFHVPRRSEKPAAVAHTLPPEVFDGARLKFTIAASRPPQHVALYARRPGYDRFWRVEAEPIGAYGYEVALPSALVRPGLIEYYISLDDSVTYPGGIPGSPNDWDFVGSGGWKTEAVEAHDSIVLFDSRRDWSELLFPHQWGYVRYTTEMVAGSEPRSLALRAGVENLDAGPNHFALQAEVLDNLVGRDLAGYDALYVRIRATETATHELTLGLIFSDGSSWTKVVPLTDTWSDLTIPLHELRPGPRVLVPRPYPIFLPYWFESKTSEMPALDDLQIVEFGLDGKKLSRDEKHGFEVEHVMIVRE